MGVEGGRARTIVLDTFRLNFGAHALSIRGANAAILNELAVKLGGSQPEAARFLAMRGGRLYSLPASALTLAARGFSTSAQSSSSVGSVPP